MKWHSRIRKLKFDLLISNLGFRVILMMKSNLLNAMTQLCKLSSNGLNIKTNQTMNCFNVKSSQGLLDQQRTFYTGSGRTGWRYQVFSIPSTMKTEVMNLCHDVPAAGHQGVSRTLSRVKERFYCCPLFCGKNTRRLGCISSSDSGCLKIL